jgi:hypothetical protein
MSEELLTETQPTPASPPSQPPQQIVVVRTKSAGIAILLAVIFGPLGLLYSTVMGAIVMFIVNILVILLSVVTMGFGLILLIFTWPTCAIWALVAVKSHNKKLLGSIYRAPLENGSGTAVPDVAVSSPEITPEVAVSSPAITPHLAVSPPAITPGVAASSPAIAPEAGPGKGTPRTYSLATVGCVAAIAVVAALALGYLWMNRLPGRSKPDSNTPADTCAFCGTWNYVGNVFAVDPGKSYLKISQAGTGKFKIIEGFYQDGRVTWHDDTVRNADGIYLKMLNGRLEGRFVTSNFLYSTHGNETTYTITCELISNNKMRYSVWSAIRGGKAEQFVATKIGN